MKAIFASKLYKTLSIDAKERVKAALTNPLNSELVTQLKSYLDEEYQAVNDAADEEVVEKSETGDATEGVETGDESSNNSTSGASGGSKSFGDKVSDIEDTLGDMPDGSESESESSSEESSDVEESTNILQTPINASLNIKNAVDEIKGMLNLDEDTHGVALVKYDDKELWVYYQDDINLNNIMYNVIAKINASGYSNLAFNRLARSDNAIVFDISAISTENVVKPIENEE